MPMEYNTAQRVVSITGSVEDLDAVISRILTYTERLEEISAKISGPGPTGKATPGIRGDVPPHSIIASINERRSALLSLADRLEHVIGLIGNAL